MSIHIEDLTVRFKNSVTAIDHADLDIPNGIFGLLGENGAGKTTLMRVLTTVLKPTKVCIILAFYKTYKPAIYILPVHSSGSGFSINSPFSEAVRWMEFLTA